MSLLINILSALCLLSGAGFIIIGCIGLTRLPDFFTRLHGTSVSETLGGWLVLAGLLLQSGWSIVSVKIITVA